jgi:type II secretory pathway pseudopilin PulG
VRARDEDGQVLLLALGFLLFFGLVIGAMLTLAGASVLGTQRLREQRSSVYAADGAVDAAIQVARSDTGVGAYGDARCQSPDQPPDPSSAVLLTTTASTPDGTTAKVVCTWSRDGLLQPDRTVTFTSFVGGTTPVVRATVTFHDSVAAVQPDATVVSWSYCGHDPTACP